MAKKPRPAGRASRRKSPAGSRKKTAARPAPRPASLVAPLLEPAAAPDHSGDETLAALPVLVAGVGASAGGFEAFSQLLASMPPTPNLAIVFVQHLSPSHQSALPQLLASSTAMPVEEATDGMIVRPNHVYVTPANVQLRLHGDALRLVSRPTDRSQYSPIDAFFRTLAENAESSAIGVLLSGNSSDGVAGLREIRAAGGTVLVQDPQSARFDSMPRAAIDAELADLVLAPSELGPALARLGSQPRSQPSGQKAGDSDDHLLRRIFVILRNATGVDFSHYKQPTIRRRLQRRMVLLKMADLGAYLHHLEVTPTEVKNLHDDFLIQVTRFFRDPESFEALLERVYPTIDDARPPDSAIRVWVPGCATGEEPYSVAMTLLEQLGDAAGEVPVQIFATDVSDSAIDRARPGIYPQTITQDVSAQRLRRFFTKIDGGYQVSKTIRDLCIFARQDLARDPPFSKLDLIVCRNVLIYLDPVLHTKLMRVFHYALRPGGFLMLGRAESVGQHGDLFQVLDKKARIFTRKAILGRADTEFSSHDGASVRSPVASRGLRQHDGQGVQGEATRLLLSRYAPPGVLVDSELRIVQARGHTGPFLELAPGDASLHLLKMAREGLLFGLRGALSEARRSSTPVRKEGLRIKNNGQTTSASVEVVPLGSNSERHFLILFETEPSSPKGAGGGRARPRSAASRRSEDKRVGQLQQELAASRDYLQSIIQDLEATNEELQSANEEILSSNEELQSTNEELDTAKEELQSTNEEINTVNEELHARNEEMSRANSDLVNLLAGVQIAIVFLTNDLRIRRFTPLAEKVLNLISTDVGRPIGNIRPNIECPGLEKMIQDVIESVNVKEWEVRDNEGKWYLLRIRPYKDIDNRIDGAVLVLLDIHVLRRQEELLKEAKDLAEAVVDTVREPLLVLETDLKVRNVNKAFCRTFGVERGESVGRALHELDSGQWNIPPLRSMLEQLTNSGDAPAVEGLEVVQDFPGIGRKRMLINAQRGPASVDSGRPFILVAIEQKPVS